MCYDVDLEKQIERMSCDQIPDYSATTCKSLKTVIGLQCFEVYNNKNDIHHEMKSEKSRSFWHDLGNFFFCSCFYSNKVNVKIYKIIFFVLLYHLPGKNGK